MKKYLLIILALPTWLFAQQQIVTYTSSPSPTFEGTDALIITVNGSSINESIWGVANNQLYAWVWALNSSNANIPYSGNGSWENSNESKLMTYNSLNDTYSFTYNPSVFTFFGSTEVAKVGFLIKAKNGTGDKKSQDIVLNVGSFQVSLLNNIVAGGTQVFSTSYTIAANHTGGTSNYVLKRNGEVINSQNNLPASSGSPSYTFSDTTAENINNYTLEVTQSGTTKSYNFSAIKAITPVSEEMPSNLQDGINYNGSDLTKATLVLSAPNKDFVYVAGNFNSWEPTLTYAMKKDPTVGKFWLEITALNPGTIYAYQYWVCDNTSVPANSPKIVKTADPYSTLVLSPFDDSEIINSGVYPGLPIYNTIAPNQQREVTVLQTGQTPFAWSAATTNFVKPKKEDLVVYEVLIRDFDANRSYQDLIDKIDYFKNLNINAIQLMPVMEFEGNESWGYNTSFHLALDKFYGPSTKLKEFVDLCHQNGIAVILDLALNHVFDRNPLVRMWMNDPDGDGWGGPSAENPYFNQAAMHSYNVGNDFNHQQARTKYYTKRVIDHWINEYKIDGFRWDLTKGFTQNCPSNVAGGQENCTNQTQADRVAVLKEYADHSWLADPNHYVIFEHLGTDGEEKQWADYRLNEGKGIMLWGKMTNEYNQLSMGYGSNANIIRAGHVSRNFLDKRLMAYAESHDEERLMYKNIQFGNASQSSHNVTSLNVALSRMSAIGAVLFAIPGPKMIWHFGALGMENSIFTCSDGSVNDSSATIPGDCKLSTKPQPQWINNWLGNINRVKIYDDWTKLISLKVNEPVFEGTYTISPEFVSGSPDYLRQRIYLSDTSLPNTVLNNVIVLANFATTNVSINPNFPYTGEWYDLMDNSTYQVNSTSATVSIPAGQFRIFGNKPALLSTADFQFANTITLAPNPTSEYFTLNSDVASVEIYSLTGQLVISFNQKYIEGDRFDVSNLTIGVYLVKMTNENNQKKVMKLIIK